MERSCGRHHHGQVDSPGQGQSDDTLPIGEAEEHAELLRICAAYPMLGQAGVQVYRVRHYGGADYSD